MICRYRNAMNALLAAVATGEHEAALFEDVDIDVMDDPSRSAYPFHDDGDQQPLLRRRHSDSSWKFGQKLR
jgi:hypothetical protein